MGGKYKLLSLLVSLFLLIIPSTVVAHQSGCHRWHSCPSDTGSYVCGDLGYSTYCSTGPVTTLKTIYEDVYVPFKVTYVDNSSLQQGATRLRTTGVNGTTRKYYTATYTNGSLTSKLWARDQVLVSSVNQVIELGTAQPQVKGNTTPINNSSENTFAWLVGTGAFSAASYAVWLYAKGKKTS